MGALCCFPVCLSLYFCSLSTGLCTGAICCLCGCAFLLERWFLRPGLDYEVALGANSCFHGLLCTRPSGHRRQFQARSGDCRPSGHRRQFQARSEDCRPSGHRRQFQARSEDCRPSGHRRQFQARSGDYRPLRPAPADSGPVRPCGAIPPTSLRSWAPPVHGATGGYAVRSLPPSGLRDAWRGAGAIGSGGTCTAKWPSAYLVWRRSPGWQSYLRHGTPTCTTELR